MHECAECGMMCDCDGEDTWLDPPANCGCPCAIEEPLDHDDEDEAPTP